jgi:hypothetical protein
MVSITQTSDGRWRRLGDASWCATVQTAMLRGRDSLLIIGRLTSLGATNGF